MRNGLDTFCLSPGSRSTPLAVAIAEHPKAKCFVHFDERGAAFFALGHARATGKAAVWVTTSGTAVANGLPAIIEAHNDRVPMIALTADRPPELRDTDSNQTINQVKIFGDFVQAHFDVPAPTEDLDTSFLLSTIDQAIARTMRPKGAVHLNCQFREPLAPSIQSFDEDHAQKHLAQWAASTKPYTAYHLHSIDAMSDGFLAQISKAKRGLLVVGKLDKNDMRTSAIIKLSNKLGFPVLADIGSGLRFYQTEPLFILSHYDQLLQSEHFKTTYQPDLVLQLGSRFTSKRLSQYLASVRPAHYFVVKDHPYRSDPNHQVTDFIEGDIAQFCSNLRQFLKIRPQIQEVLAWREAWLAADDDVGHLLEAHFAHQTYLTEPVVSFQIAQLISSQQGLFIGNSMPIRDMDMFASAEQKRVYVAANRGASGIDGVLSSAIGFANGLQLPTTLLIGDLSLLHDLNGLAQLRQSEQPLVIVVINNNGGGIFSFLPIAEHSSEFETMFGTPHGLDFSHAAKMFGLVYHQPTTVMGFNLVYQNALTSGKSVIIEVRTNRKENVEAHTIIREKVLEMARNA